MFNAVVSIEFKALGNVICFHVSLHENQFPMKYMFGVYRANGFAVFRSCGTNHDRKLVLLVSIGAYERKPAFSLPFGKYFGKSFVLTPKCL